MDEAAKAVFAEGLAARGHRIGWLRGISGNVTITGWKLIEYAAATIELRKHSEPPKPRPRIVARI